jgi:hypothetical protein
MKTRLLLTFSSILILSFTLSAQNYGVWKEIDSMNIARFEHAIGELPNGDIIVSGNGYDSLNSSCEIYDRTIDKWRFTTNLNISRSGHRMILLNNGLLLTVGGYREKSCEIFDPTSETWTMTDSLIFERWFGQVVLKLTDGNVMVIGGIKFDTTVIPWKREVLDKVEIFDVALQKWIQVGSLNIGRAYHTATLLYDGKVLVTGGEIDSGSTNTCELYDPVNKSWRLVSPMNEIRDQHSALLIDSNRVLVSGSGGLLQFVKKSCEVYLINENIWIQAGDMFIYRHGHLMLEHLKTKKIMIIGGDIGNPFYCNDSYEFYDKDSLTSTLLLPFPTSQTLGTFNIQTNMFQTINNEVYIIGGHEIICYPMPFVFPTKRCWVFDTATEVENMDYKAEEFQLYQNFPNPFNPVTTIGYNLKEQSKVELKVFDILGNEVITLVDDIQQAGYHQAEFNSNNLEKGLSSGIYLYQIKARGTEESKTFWQKTNKMILLK